MPKTISTDRDKARTGCNWRRDQSVATGRDRVKNMSKEGRRSRNKTLRDKKRKMRGKRWLVSYRLIDTQETFQERFYTKDEANAFVAERGLAELAEELNIEHE